MRSYILCIFLIILSLPINAAIIEIKENSIMEVYYIKTAEEDTLKRNVHLEISPMTLRIGPTSSMFYATKNFWADSLRTFDFNTLMEINTARLESGDPDWWRPLGGDEWEYIFKNIPAGYITATCLFDREQRFYEEPWEKPVWEISDSTKTILGMECIKAETHYRGREWTAWFTPEIAIQDGPGKLCNLPGLILEAYDTKRHYSFIATGIAYTDKLKVGRYFFCVYPPTKMTRNEYFQHRHWHMNKHAEDFLEERQHLAHMTGAEAPRTIADLKIDTTFYVKRDFEETDYPHKWRKSQQKAK